MHLPLLPPVWRVNRSLALAYVGRAIAATFPEIAGDIIDAAFGAGVSEQPSEMRGVMVVEGRCGGCGMNLGTVHVKTWGGWTFQHVFRPHDVNMPCRDPREVQLRFRAPLDNEPGNLTSASFKREG